MAVALRIRTLRCQMLQVLVWEPARAWALGPAHLQHVGGAAALAEPPGRCTPRGQAGHACCLP